MELKLYNYLRKVGLSNNLVDFRETIYQERLEKFDKSLGLDNKILNKVHKLLKTYNKYLKLNNMDEVKLRYYQILSLYYTQLYLEKKDEHGFEFSMNSIAYWMATGSGKTIIMHLNILQYIAYCKSFKDFELIMTTPGVNLIEQHERELVPFLDFLNVQFNNKIRLTIDTTMGLLAKSEDFFEFPNTKTYRRLILVDEAHIGLSTTAATGTDGAFMDLRKRLNIKNSFLFEYSATFHNINSTLEKEYEKSIVYDYNYNLFYKDGYGKDYFFQQIGDDVLEKSFDDNLHHNLFIINEKIELWNNIDYALERSLFDATQFPDKPLIAFMGNTVNNKEKSAKNEDPEVSDITNIVNFLANLSEKNRKKYKYLFNDNYKGRLTLTKNPQAEDEILLSYGHGDYWGIVNVGNGAKFINGLENQEVIKNPKDKIIISNIEKYSFRNIDHKHSPINVLIGSRKFAEGWNCFRVSVIGLINLGTSKGNKIIQIFGRGVRIKGLKNDGKRIHLDHNEDYFDLSNENEKDKLRKLETLCVFSLKKSYIETFTNSVNKELEIIKRFEIIVNPSIVKLQNNTEITFEEFRKKIPIFKLSKHDISQRRVYLSPSKQSFECNFMQENVIENGNVNNFTVSLDYRPDKSQVGIDIKGELSNFLTEYSDFINASKLKSTIDEYQEEHSLYVYKDKNVIRVNDILFFIDKIEYKEHIKVADIEFIENILITVIVDFLKKLNNKVNWYINNSNYEFGEDLTQRTETTKGKGDFIDRYYIYKTIDSTKEVRGKTIFKKEQELVSEIKEFENSIGDIADRLKIQGINQHIYNPLLRDTENIDDEKDLKITPDKLNAGEKKFIEDISEYFLNNDKYNDCEIYLMRNVETLKSIGIYLNDDSQVFYPDFILWMLKDDTVYISFIDPKGQMGMQDFNTLDDNEKVRVADKQANDTLSKIEEQLSIKHKKKFILNSFLLLRDSSNMGTTGESNTYAWQKTNMIDKNIFRLNWHSKDEKMNIVDKNKLPNGDSYLQIMMGKIIS